MLRTCQRPSSRSERQLASCFLGGLRCEGYIMGNDMLHACAWCRGAHASKSSTANRARQVANMRMHRRPCAGDERPLGVSCGALQARCQEVH